MEQAPEDLRSTFDSILNRTASNEPTYSSASTIRKPSTPVNTNVFKRISPLGWVVVISIFVMLVFTYMKRPSPTAKQQSLDDIYNKTEQYDTDDPLFQPFDD